MRKKANLFRIITRKKAKNKYKKKTYFLIAPKEIQAANPKVGATKHGKYLVYFFFSFTFLMAKKKQLQLALTAASLRAIVNTGNHLYDSEKIK